MMQLTNKIAYTTCLLAIFAGGCSTKTTENSGHSATSPATATKVTVHVAKEMEYIPVLNFTGTAEANREAALGASIPGRVEKIHFAKGSYVPEGAVIAEMSDEMLIQAQIELEAIRKDFERISRLKEKESVSVMDYDHMKAKFDASQTKVNMLKKNTSITAPFGGVLTDITVQEGENYTFVPSVSSDLKMQSGILTIRQLNPLKIIIEVNEKRLTPSAGDNMRMWCLMLIRMNPFRESELYFTCPVVGDPYRHGRGYHSQQGNEIETGYVRQGFDLHAADNRRVCPRKCPVQATGNGRRLSLCGRRPEPGHPPESHSWRIKREPYPDPRNQCR